MKAWQKKEKEKEKGELSLFFAVQLLTEITSTVCTHLIVSPGKHLRHLYKRYDRTCDTQSLLDAGMKGDKSEVDEHDRVNEKIHGHWVMLIVAISEDCTPAHDSCGQMVKGVQESRVLSL